MNTWTPAATVKQTTCLCRDTGGKGTLPAQHTTFNTLDNLGHKPPNQKGKGPERKVIGHGPEHVYNTLGYNTKKEKELYWSNKFLSNYTLINGQFLKKAYAWNIENMCVHKHMRCVCVCARACACLHACVCSCVRVCFVTDKQQH